MASILGPLSAIAAQDREAWRRADPSLARTAFAKWRPRRRRRLRISLSRRRRRCAGVAGLLRPSFLTRPRICSSAQLVRSILVASAKTSCRVLCIPTPASAEACRSNRNVKSRHIGSGNEPCFPCVYIRTPQLPLDLGKGCVDVQAVSDRVVDAAHLQRGHRAARRRPRGRHHLGASGAFRRVFPRHPRNRRRRFEGSTQDPSNAEFDTKLGRHEQRRGREPVTPLCAEPRRR